MWKRKVLLLVPTVALAIGTAIAAGPTPVNTDSVAGKPATKKGTCTTQTKYRLNGQIKSQSTTCTDVKAN
jgi:hypothetical protein